MPTTFGGNPTFRSIWLATQVSSLSWLMQTVSTFDLMVALVQASSNPRRLHFVRVPYAASPPH
nr:MFS transporter [Mesorhizobium sp. M4A.F.Ca.ET.022.05.2.1]